MPYDFDVPAAANSKATMNVPSLPMTFNIDKLTVAGKKLTFSFMVEGQGGVRCELNERDDKAYEGTCVEDGGEITSALERHGVGVEKGRYGASWTTDPARRASDLALVRGWLEEEEPPAMLHRAAPWGPVPISGMPVTLAIQQADKAMYRAKALGRNRVEVFGEVEDAVLTR